MVELDGRSANTFSCWRFVPVCQTAAAVAEELEALALALPELWMPHKPPDEGDTARLVTAIGSSNNQPDESPGQWAVPAIRAPSAPVIAWVLRAEVELQAAVWRTAAGAAGLGIRRPVTECGPYHRESHAPSYGIPGRPGRL